MSENAQNFVETLSKEDIQSVSSNGVSITLRGASDKKAEIEAEILANKVKYNPLLSMFSADKWGNPRK